MHDWLHDAKKKKVIEDQSRGLKIQIGKDLFSTERDQALAKAKIILNIHAYEDSKDIELWRLNYLASNGLYVLSEESIFESGEERIKRHVYQASIEDLAGKAEELARQYDQDKAKEKGKELREAAIEIQAKGSSCKSAQRGESNMLEKLHLNLSCGQTYYEDSINIDTENNSRADLKLEIGVNWEKIEGLHIRKDKRKAALHASQFDVIEANNTLHTTDELKQTLSNICRLLKPGGVFYMKGPYQGSDDAWANPKNKREINEKIIPYLNEWSKLTGLQDTSYHQYI